MLEEVAADAKLSWRSGTCAPMAAFRRHYPNPTGAVGVEDLVSNKPIVNIPGCPPVRSAEWRVVHFISFGRLPELDDRKRPWLISAPRSTISAIAVRSRPGQIREVLRLMTAHGRAGACSSLVARDPLRTTPAPA